MIIKIWKTAHFCIFCWWQQKFSHSLRKIFRRSWKFFQKITWLIGFVFAIHVFVCVFIPFHHRGFSWQKLNNKCNARDQASDVALRISLCVKYIHHHIIDNHSRDLQASNCARVSIKPGGATRSKRQLLKLSKTNGKSAKHSYLSPH